MTIKCLISDLDGTLLYTEEANWAAYERAFADFGFPVSRGAYREAFGLRLDDMVRSVAPGFPVEEIPGLKRRKAEYYSKLVHLVVPNQSLIHLLRELKGSVALALATTASRANAEMLLCHFELREIFDVLVFGEDTQRGKPDPECYAVCIQRCGMRPDECLVFEDSDVGIRAALAAGANVLRVPATVFQMRRQSNLQ